ncbi:MAG: alginate export family protein [Bacteroidota bacterium]|nr:alginate export family protein [Bacteroidota bacterium]
MRKKMVFRLAAALVFISASFHLNAQLAFSGQLRTRTELRDGYGTLESVGSQPAFLTSQRTRLTFNFHSGHVTLQASVQDLRVWGADASTISNADGSRLGVHEAWAELVLSDARDSSFKRPAFEYLSLKIGRQELVYDDQRLLGNLDWLQQARRHDAVVLKWRNKGWQADLGAAYSQNTDAFNYNGTYYTPANLPPYIKDSKGNLVPTPSGLVPLANASGISARSGSPLLANAPSTNGMNQNYKSMQFLYVARKVHRMNLSALLFADEFGKYTLDSVRSVVGADTGYIYGRRFASSGVNARVTAGLLLAGPLNKQNDLRFTAGAWYQGGKNKDGLDLSAFMSTISLSYVMGNFTCTTGWDYLSGNDGFSSSPSDHRFDPLYGTPHKFWGIMDYFYAGTGSSAGGLSNPFVKIKVAAPDGRMSLGLDYHYFAMAAAQKDQKGLPLNKYLGSELDLVGNYALNKNATLELGLCGLAASGSMEYAKGIAPGTARLAAHWAYLQVNVKI